MIQAGPVTWVLLRGLGREAGYWGDFKQKLAAAFPGSRVLTPDLPGCGTEHAQRPATTVAGLLACIRAAVRAAAPSGPLHLVGLSLGGMIALEWMQRHPDDVAGAVLINTSVAGVSPPWLRLRPGAIWGLVRAALASDASARERLVFGFTSARPERQTEVLTWWTELARTRPIQRSSTARQLLAGARYRLPRPATGTTSPTPEKRPAPLFLVSRQDAMVAPACSFALAKRLGAPVRLHETAGHDLALDDPDWVITQLTDWQSRAVE